MTTDQINADDLALKFGTIVHDARVLGGLLRRLSGDEATLSEALNLVDLIAGTANAGAELLPEPAPEVQLQDHRPDRDGWFAMRGHASMFSTCSSVLSSRRGESTGDDRRRFHAVLCELLEAARAGGFPDGLADELDAAVLAGRINGRSVALAHEAARCAGDARCLAIAGRHGI